MFETRLEHFDRRGMRTSVMWGTGDDKWFQRATGSSGKGVLKTGEQISCYVENMQHSQGLFHFTFSRKHTLDARTFRKIGIPWYSHALSNLHQIDDHMEPSAMNF
jgi:hypothetical protein